MNPEKNCIHLIGTVVREPVFDHELYGERFFSMLIGVKRDSGTVDLLPVTVSDRLTDAGSLQADSSVEIEGQIRSYSSFENGRSHLVLTVFAKSIGVVYDAPHENRAELCGEILHSPVCRKTPLGREISDMMLNVRRSYKKRDCVPVIAWGRNAQWCSRLEDNSRIYVKGRLQSRVYIKTDEQGERIKRVTYEVSASRVELAPEEPI